MRGFIAQNPASSLQISAYTTDVATLDLEIDRRRQRVREVHRPREARFDQENSAQLEADEQELDAEFDARQRRLDIHFESNLHPTRQPEHDTNHPMPREGIGTRDENPHSQFHILDLAHQNRFLSWDGPSGHASGHPSFVQYNLPTLSAVESDPRSDQGLVAMSLDDLFLPPLAMTAGDIESEAFHDVARRQTWPLTAAREIQAEPDPADFVPTHTDETLGFAHAIVLPVSDTRNGSNSGFEALPQSGDRNSCSCAKVCPKGQYVCDSCDDSLAVPYSF